MALVSYCNTNSGDTASIVNSVLGSSIIESSVISVKKERCYMDGLNKSIDLKGFFEFKGETSIDDVEFVALVEGHQASSRFRAIRPLHKAVG